jgi:hypothetical protein
MPTPTSVAVASYARTQPGPAVGNAAGSISGHVNCACGGLPAQDIYAISTDGGHFYVTQTVADQTQYRMLGVAAGSYFVYTAMRSVQVGGAPDDRVRRFSTAYTKAIACGFKLTCTDHSAVAVTVRAGANTGGVDSTDWFGRLYPLVPVAGPPLPTLPAAPSSFKTAEAAARYVGAQTTAGRYIATAGACPVNVACFWMKSMVSGTGAAYYVGAAGSNGQSLQCVMYLIGSGSSWHPLDAFCVGSLPFPTLGASGKVVLEFGATGCANVRRSPTDSAVSVVCLRAGTSVTVDRGPVYTASKSTDLLGKYWWHIAGKGWVTQRYLEFFPIG